MDAMEVCYNVLRIQYLSSVGEAFLSAGSWQAAEAALFALRWLRRTRTSPRTPPFYIPSRKLVAAPGHEWSGNHLMS